MNNYKLKMGDQEITNMLIDIAGFQRLPTNININEYQIDESESLYLMEKRIYDYINLIDNFNKLIHDKVKIKLILNNILKIIDEYPNEINNSFKILWEYIINDDKSEKIIIENINKIKHKIINNEIKLQIDNDIRNSKKIKPLVKKLLNIGIEFINKYETNFNYLTKIDQLKYLKTTEDKKKYIEILDTFIKNINFNNNSDSLISNFYEYIRKITDNKIRNDFFNEFMLNTIKEIKKVNKIQYQNILVQLYLYVKNNEKNQFINPIINKYFENNNLNWFSYQIQEMSDILYPHWNYKVKDFQLDPWQRECLKNIDQKNNILLSAPTSAGKTLLSTYAINKYRKIIYIVPSNALAYQLTGIIIASLLDIEKKIGIEKKNVRIIIDTFDYSIYNSIDNIIIGTPKEIYKYINKNNINPDFDYIILDEFHNISYDNGKYYEYILKYGGFNKIPVMCLSATIPNFEEVYDWLKNILYGNIYGVNEKRRFFNQKRLIIKDKKLVTINPIQKLKKETIKSIEFTHIGLYPKEVLKLHNDLNLKIINENDRKFVKLDDIHKLECDIFNYIKNNDILLDKLVNNDNGKDIESDQLSLYELYIFLKNCNSSMKPMLIFKMNSEKSLEIYNNLINLMVDYNKLVYDNYDDDQIIIQEYFNKLNIQLEKIKLREEENIDDIQNLLRETIFNSEIKEKLKKFYDDYEKYCTLKISNDNIPSYVYQKDIDNFNKKYGADITVNKIIELRKEFTHTEWLKCNQSSISLRGKTYTHPKTLITNFSIPPEEMRKIKNKINREIQRELKIYSNNITLSEEFDIYSLKNLDTLSYDHPYIRGIECGLLCYNKLCNPALQRISQQLINKYPFITLSDSSLAVGINYPIKTVMLLGGLKGEPIEDLENSLAHQAIGRAGRRGLDKEGIIIYNGLNLDNILVQKYKKIVPNNISIMEELVENDSYEMKHFIITGERLEKKQEPIKISEIIKEISLPIKKEENIIFDSWEEYL
jgi:hypothetical protein